MALQAAEAQAMSSRLEAALEANSKQASEAEAILLKSEKLCGEFKAEAETLVEQNSALTTKVGGVGVMV